MTTYNLRESSKHGIPTPKEGYEQRKVAYKKYNEAAIKGWSKRVDDGKDYTDKDFILCERKVIGGEFVETPAYGDPVISIEETVNRTHEIREITDNIIGQTIIITNNSDDVVSVTSPLQELPEKVTRSTKKKYHEK